jgi:hypothetical protein
MAPHPDESPVSTNEPERKRQPPAGISAGRELALVSLFYLLITTAVTYPMPVRLTTHIPGAGDAPTMVWDLWGMTRAILDPQIPLSVTDLIFYPLPDVANIWTSPASVLISLPLTLTCGHLCSYNLLFLSSFVLAGLFCYLLVRYLTGNRLASFVAGTIFSFSAFHYARGLGHWSLCFIQWIPLCILCLLRLHDRPDLRRTLQFAIVMGVLTLTFSYYWGYFLLPLLACFFAYHLWKDKSTLLRPRFLAAVAIALAVSAAGTLLFFHRVLIPDEDMAAALRTSAKDTERYSADLLAFVAPSARHPLFGSLTSPIYGGFSSGENLPEATVYLGGVAVLFAFWGLWCRRRKDGPLWAILALLTFIMSLGPVLHVGGQSLFPLPYALLMRLPFFNGYRAPARAGMTVLMSVSVLAGYGVDDILDRMRSGSPVKALMTAMIVFVVCFESMFSFPYPSSSAAVPRFYEQMVTKSDGEALFQVPSGVGDSDSTGWYMFYQSHHHRKLAIGYQAREPLPVVLFPHWLLRGKFLSPPVSLFETDNWPAFEASFADLLAYNDIRYVVIQRQAGPSTVSYGMEEYSELKASLARSLGEPFYEDDGLTAHEVSTRAAEVRASFGGQLELIDHRLVRTTSCPDGADDCTFLVTFWRANERVDKRYALFFRVTRQDQDRLVALGSHGLGYQFRHGEEVAYYNTTWWAPGVVIADYTLLPSTNQEGALLSGPLDIRIFVAHRKTQDRLEARSDYYAIDDEGRLLIDSYSP